jgi:large subunit ribosomal protein L30
MSTKQLRVKLVKSIAGRIKYEKTAARSLGLIRNGQTVIVDDTAKNKALIKKASALISVEEITWESLRSDEADYMEAIIAELEDNSWAKPLLKRLEEAGGITRRNKSLLFEIRLAHALHKAGITPVYEAPGEGDSTIDFQFESKGTIWNVELTRLEETEAAKRATNTTIEKEGYEFSQRSFSSTADDPRESEAGETLKAIERICQKCEKDDKPHKFKVPTEGTVNVLLVDFRNFLDGDGDESDMKHIANGGDGLHQMARREYEGKQVTGAFEEETKLKGSAYLRERVHLIGFVKEEEYKPGEFRKAIHFIPNPHLLNDPKKATALLKTWPFSDSALLH